MENSFLPNNLINGVGIDIVSVSRFVQPSQNKDDPFLCKVFSNEEREYCFSYQNPHIHFAGFFALKEATSKALGVHTYPFAEINVHHTQDGAPYVSHNHLRLPVVVSISHTDEVAIAIAIVQIKPNQATS